MMRLPRALPGLVLLLATAGCATGMDAEMDSSRPFGFSRFDQRGLDKAAGPPDSPRLETGMPVLGNRPGRGFFHDDGNDGDLRARTENHFSTPRDRTSAPSADPVPAEPPDRKMVYSASYSLMVPVVADAIQALTARVEAAGGYLSSREDATLTVRVPAAKFSGFIAGIPELGRVLSESMSANDVTEQHTDLTIRLENAEKARQRLLALFEKATVMKDILEIEAALQRLTGEIERLKGQLELMNDRIAHSTITVSLVANAPEVQKAGQRPQSRFPWINQIGIEQDLRRFRP